MQMHFTPATISLPFCVRFNCLLFSALRLSDCEQSFSVECHDLFVDTTELFTLNLTMRVMVC